MGLYHVQVNNCKLQLKVNCRKKFGLVCQLLAEPAQILPYNSLLVYNSLSAAIRLCMIWAMVLEIFCLLEHAQLLSNLVIAEFLNT